MVEANYPPAIAALLTPRLPVLGPGQPNASALPALQALTPATLAPQVRDHAAATACLSGLWLYHDYLTESHALSQDLPDVNGSYWHAIMHRREPDAWNSKYWFRKVANHPVLVQLETTAQSRDLNYRNPFDFIDLCERVRGTNTPDEVAAQQVQVLEWQLLFDWCFHQAFPESARNEPAIMRRP